MPWAPQPNLIITDHAVERFLTEAINRGDRKLAPDQATARILHLWADAVILELDPRTFKGKLYSHGAKPDEHRRSNIDRCQHGSWILTKSHSSIVTVHWRTAAEERKERGLRRSTREYPV